MNTFHPLHEKFCSHSFFNILITNKSPRKTYNSEKVTFCETLYRITNGILTSTKSFKNNLIRENYENISGDVDDNDDNGNVIVYRGLFANDAVLLAHYDDVGVCVYLTVTTGVIVTHPWCVRRVAGGLL